MVRKEVLYIYFLSFGVLTFKSFESPYFPFLLTATLILFTAYALRFRWQELLPGALIVAALLGLLSLFSPTKAQLNRVEWIKELPGHRRVALLNGGRWIGLKDERVEVGDVVSQEGELLAKSDSITAELLRLRYSLYKKIEEKIDYPVSAVVGACTLGVRYELPYSTRGYFALSGLYHFLAISGLHVGVVVGALAGLLKLLKFRRPITTASLLILPLMPLTGLPPSAVRAYLFILLLGLGVEEFRKISPLYLLGVVMLITTLFEKFNLSATLSFLAVGGIILQAEAPGSRLEKGLRVAAAPFLFTLPVILHAFGTVNSASWVSTVLVGFVFSPFLVLSFLSQITALKVDSINSATQLLGELFIRATQLSFFKTKWWIIHSEISLTLAGITLLTTLALITLGRKRLSLLPLALLLLYAAFNQTVVRGKELKVEGWRLNSFRFVTTEGQRYEECRIYGTYVMPATRKLLFKSSLIDARLKELERGLITLEEKRGK